MAEVAEKNCIDWMEFYNVPENNWTPAHGRFHWRMERPFVEGDRCSQCFVYYAPQPPSKMTIKQCASYVCDVFDAMDSSSANMPKWWPQMREGFKERMFKSVIEEVAPK